MDQGRVRALLEPLCISRGLPLPRCGVIHDAGCNAFALGRTPRNSRIVVSTGLIQSLNDRQLTAVLAHELSHIINYDTRLMTMVTVFLGAVGSIAQICFRMPSGGQSSTSSATKNYLMIFAIGGLCFLLSQLFLPIIRLSLSRRREFLADAGAILLTKDPDGLIEALSIVSSQSHIASIQDDPTIALLCIVSQKGEKVRNNEEQQNKKSKKREKKISRRQGWRQTHPSIDERIEAIRAIS